MLRYLDARAAEEWSTAGAVEIDDGQSISSTGNNDCHRASIVMVQHFIPRPTNVEGLKRVGTLEGLREAMQFKKSEFKHMQVCHLFVGLSALLTYCAVASPEIG
jgi:hypothetical protein